MTVVHTLGWTVRSGGLHLLCPPPAFLPTCLFINEILMFKETVFCTTRSPVPLAEIPPKNLFSAALQWKPGCLCCLCFPSHPAWASPRNVSRHFCSIFNLWFHWKRLQNLPTTACGQTYGAPCFWKEKRTKGNSRKNDWSAGPMLVFSEEPSLGT